MSSVREDFPAVEDMFKELGSVGSGHASTALSEIFNKNFLIEIKEVKFNKDEIAGQFLNNKKSDDLIMISKISGLINGLILLNSNKAICKKGLINGIIEYSSTKSAHKYDDKAFYDFIDINGFEEVFYEIFNIGIGYYLSAIANLINEKISVTEVEFNSDDSKILQSVLKNIDEYMCVETSIVYKDSKEIAGTYLFMVDKKSLDKIMNKYKSHKVLICDETSFVRVVVKDIILKNYPSMVVEEAKNGNEAFEKYKELNPSLVIMDMVMHDCDGIKATENILKHDPKAKIILSSGAAVQMEVIRAINAGAKDFISKPYDAKRILDTVKKFLIENKTEQN